MKLGQIIKEYREANDLTLTDFAKRSGLSRTYVYHIESGINAHGVPFEPDGVDVLNSCAKAMRMSFTDLYVKIYGDRDNGLTSEEYALIKAYRKAPLNVKTAIQALLK